jgi:hypothetical protein
MGYPGVRGPGWFSGMRASRGNTVHPFISPLSSEALWCEIWGEMDIGRQNHHTTYTESVYVVRCVSLPVGGQIALGVELKPPKGGGAYLNRVPVFDVSLYANILYVSPLSEGCYHCMLCVYLTMFP